MRFRAPSSILPEYFTSTIATIYNGIHISIGHRFLGQLVKPFVNFIEQVLIILILNLKIWFNKSPLIEESYRAYIKLLRQNHTE